MGLLATVISKFKIGNKIYEIKDEQSRNDIASINDNISSINSNISSLNSEKVNIEQFNTKTTEIEQQHSSDVETLRSLINEKINELSENLSGVDSELLETLNQLKSELNDPTNESLTTFLDKVNTVLGGLEENKTIASYIEDIENLINEEKELRVSEDNSTKEMIKELQDKTNKIENIEQLSYIESIEVDSENSEMLVLNFGSKDIIVPTEKIEIENPSNSVIYSDTSKDYVISGTSLDPVEIQNVVQVTGNTVNVSNVVSTAENKGMSLIAE